MKSRKLSSIVSIVIGTFHTSQKSTILPSLQSIKDTQYFSTIGSAPVFPQSISWAGATLHHSTNPSQALRLWRPTTPRNRHSLLPRQVGQSRILHHPPSPSYIPYPNRPLVRLLNKQRRRRARTRPRLCRNLDGILTQPQRLQFTSYSPRLCPAHCPPPTTP